MAIRILVVDDSVVIRKLLTATLEEVPGLEVVATAALGRIALAKIPQCQPDVVILDVEMPEMDGIETLRQIRKLAPRLPVIMFSTKTERGAAATIEALTSGASDYVTKPSNVGNVLLAMARVREEMVPKILALTSRTPPELRPPLGSPAAATLAASPPAPPAPVASTRSRPSTKLSSDAIARPPGGDPRPPPRPAAPASGSVPVATQAIASSTAAERSATTRLAAFSAQTTMAMPAVTQAAPGPGAAEPRPASRLAAMSQRLATVTTQIPLAAQASPGALGAPTASDPRPPSPRFAAGRRALEIVAIGASTGGPNALATLLTQLPADFPVPIVIVQHMLATFTRHFAERLASQCSIKIVEATAGDALLPGHAYIARGDYHLLVERRAGRAIVATNQDEVENYCRPAVDVLFRSVAQLYGGGALAVVLTGMGHDGLAGSGAIREAGGDVIVQDEATSVVWGMPGFVARAGLASLVMPIEQLGGELRRRATPSGARGVEATP